LLNRAIIPVFVCWKSV